MKPTQLLPLFDRISDTPDAIPRLRRFILDLAVRGKLVEQNSKDEPASELLKRIQAEKDRLMKAGEIRKQDPARPINKEEVPFEIPPGWCWVRLIDVLNKLTDGTHHSPTNLAAGAFKYITAKNIKPEGVSLSDLSYVTANVHREIYARCNPEKGDILYIKDGATTGIVTINNLDEPFSMLSSVALLKLSTHVYNRLIVEFLRSPFFYMQMRGFMKGAAITRVTLKRMAPVLIPLPPLAEQHRIVAKVDELVALCDRLEVAQAERENRRDRLVVSSLNRLNDGTDADAFRDHGRFYFNHLPRLTTRSEHIQQLRQTILNLAVRGKLVSQDPNEEPVGELLRKITGEKAQMVREGKIKAEKDTAHMSSGRSPFDVPKGWMWSDLQHLFALVTDGDHQAPPKSEEGIPFLVIGNLNTRKISFAGCKYVPVEYYKKLDWARKPSLGDILYTVTGSFGIPIPVETDKQFCVQRHVAILKIADSTPAKYVTLVLGSIFALNYAAQIATGIAQKTIPLTGLRRMQIPLPPEAEQYRIVAKVEELMALCEQLESHLTSTEIESRRLLEAVLHEALAPTV